MKHLQAIKHFSLILVVTLVALTTGCNSKEKKKTKTLEDVLKERAAEGENIGSPLDIYVTSFLSKHPEILNNEVTFENAKKEFANEFAEKLKSGIVNDMEFSCLSVDKDFDTGKPVATFSFGSTAKDSSYSATVFATTPVTDEQAAKLKTTADYKIDGTFSIDKDDLKDEYGLGPQYLRFDKKFLRSPGKVDFCIVINAHRVKLHMKSFTEVVNKK